MTASNAPTKKLDVAKQSFAYRSFGKSNTKPLVLLNHLAANLDNWDPRVLDLLAEQRTVVIFDNSGVGSSSGKVPQSIEEMAEDAATFISNFSKQPVDVIGLSMGGMVTQELAVRHPEILNKIVLVGTGPKGGKGIENVTSTTFKSILKAALTRADAKEFIFFKRNTNGKTAAKVFLSRLAERPADKDVAISPRAFISQLKAIKKFAKAPAQSLKSISNQVLVINGDHDIMVPTALSFELAERLPNSRIEIFADSGHGSLFQFPERFAKSVLTFLNE
jgi:pimeloyl-ACP methyl ester carboxylesterase